MINNIKQWHVSSNRSVQYDIVKGYRIFEDDLYSSLFQVKSLSENVHADITNIRRFVVLDANVQRIYGTKIKEYFSKNNISATIYPFVSGEENKNFSSYFELIQALKEWGITRRSEPIIAIGGGILTDIVGFVASSYRRGILHINVPTTLIGYVDAAIGIKGGLNYKEQKNRIGAFYPPVKVILDASFFSSLSYRHIRNGVGEILKLAIIKDQWLFEMLEQHGKLCIQNKFQDLHVSGISTALGTNIAQSILDRSITDMLEELEPNLFEDNLIRNVDFGHTFSTAIEMYLGKEIYHGEAVVMDMFLSSVLAYNRQKLSLENLLRIVDLMKLLQLNTHVFEISAELLWESVVERTEHRNGQQSIPLPCAIGSCFFVNDITKGEIQATLSIINQGEFYAR